MAITARTGQTICEDPLGSELQQELRDLLCLAVAGDHVRWVLAGGGTAELARWLREAAEQWRTWADLVAGGLAARGVAPDGRIRSLARDVPLNWVPPGWLSPGEARQLMASRLAKVCEWARYRRSQATEPGTQRLLDLVCAGMEAQSARLAEITPQRPGTQAQPLHPPGVSQPPSSRTPGRPPR